MLTGESLPVEKDRRRRSSAPHSTRRADSFSRRPRSEVTPRLPRSCGWSSRRRDRRRRCSAWPTVSPALRPGRAGLAALTFGLDGFRAGPRVHLRAHGGVAVLIIACPCALGSGRADRDHGRHRQGGRERHPDPRRRGTGSGARINTIVLDKTGTITRGKPAVDAGGRRPNGFSETSSCAWPPRPRSARSIRSARRSSSGAQELRSRAAEGGALSSR